MTLKTKTTLYIIVAAAGLALAVASRFLLDGIFTDTQQGALSGMGSGLFGFGLVKFSFSRWSDENPEEMRRSEIEANDERNVAIRHRAQALSGNVIVYAVMVMAWVCIFLDAPLWMTLTCIGIFVAKTVLDLFLTAYYEKRM